MKNALVMLALASVMVVGLGACTETAQQKEAIAFREKCAKDPALAECKAAKEQGLGAQ
jgi:hypothetical protein